MKRISIVLLGVLLCMIFVGCSDKSDEQYQQAMIDGESKVIEEEYDKAIDYFELALDIKEDDVEAENLIQQLDLLTASLETSGLDEEESYFYQIEKLEKINSINTQRDIVKKKANKCKQVALANIDNCIADIEEDIDHAKYQSCQKELEGMIKECKEYECLKTQLDRCNKLLDVCVKNTAKQQYNQVGNQQTKVAGSVTTQRTSTATNHNRYCKYGAHYVSSGSYNSYTGRCYSCDKACASQGSCTNTGSTTSNNTTSNNNCNNTTSSTHHSTTDHHSGGHH